MNKDQAKEEVKELIEKYEQIKSSGKIKTYTEESTKKDFILPLFKALGWKVDEDEVSAEEYIISSGRVDYGFYINGRAKFYLEAKPLKADLNNEDYARQAIRYSWNKGVTWAILTDFESIKVFNAQLMSKYLTDKLFFSINVNEYIDRFDQLWLLSKESFLNNNLDKEAEKVGKKILKTPVTDSLYKDLNKSRDLLLHDLSLMNEEVNKDLLEEGVQRLLDRLIFIRVAEDRGIEPSTLIPLLRAWKNSDRKIGLYASMVSKFRELDKYYNSSLFSPHPFENWLDYGDSTEKVIQVFYGNPGYYEYDFSIMPADILGSVYENYLGYKLSQSQKGLTLDQAAGKRKKQGIYYTPTFIVDYIVRNALKPVLNNCKSVNDLKKIKVLDPACGSGSFLIKALEVILEKYEDFNVHDSEYLRIQIILENIFGVDLDEQAVEIARLNLLINALKEREKLPSLENNIKNGNSLISGTDEELEKYFGKNFRDKKPFNWEEQFPEVFKQGGFDVIIGNPPYINAKNGNFSLEEKDYFNNTFKVNAYQLDSYILFIEKSFNLLKDNGLLGYIIPNSWLSNVLFTKIRKFLLDRTKVIEVVETKDKVFGAASVDVVVLIVEKELKEKKNNFIEVGNFVNDNYENKGKVLQDSLKDQNLVFSINVDNSSLDIIRKIDKNSIKIKDILDISTGIKEYQVGKGKPLQTQQDKDQLRFNSNIKKDSTFVPEIRGKNINNYSLDWNSEYVSYGKWLAEPRQEKYFKGARLLLRKIPGKNKLIASYTEKDFIVDQSLYIGLESNKDFDMKYLLGMLNSRLIGWYFKNKNNEFDTLFPQIKITQFKDLPVAKVDINAQAEIVSLVNKILKLNEQLKDKEKNSNKWNSIKDEIDKIDKKIDEEVYKLYDLTPEEIKIVENSWNSI